MVTNQFDAFNEELCEVHWYWFSIEIQKNFLVLILDSQQPVHIRGYGNIDCTRDAFERVNF